MTLFKQRKNKRFNYKPRHQSDHEDIKPDDMESKWDNVRKTSKQKKGSILTSMPFMILFLIVTLIVFYILNRYE